MVAQHVREIWTQTLRFTGDMAVRGRWFFRPVRWLDVGPADVDVSSLTVAKGAEQELFKAVHGHIVATIHPFDVRVPQGLELLEHVSLRTDLDGQVEAATLVSALAGFPCLSRSPTQQAPSTLMRSSIMGALCPALAWKRLSTAHR